MISAHPRTKAAEEMEDRELDLSETVVLVPDPDNERGVRAIGLHTGAIVATGHLVVDTTPDASATDKLGATVRFVGVPVAR